MPGIAIENINDPLVTELRAHATAALKLANQVERRAVDLALKEVVRPAWARTGLGFVRTDPVKLAAALEAVRRRICAYCAVGDQPCDCKYGLDVDGKRGPGSEQTGCPELRCVIEGLLLAAEDTKVEPAAGAESARARSCPTCHSPVQVRLGPYDDQACTDTWHNHITGGG